MLTPTVLRHWLLNRRVLIFVGIVLICVPFIVPWIYHQLTAIPQEITITLGPEGGLYREFSENLAATIEDRLGITVHRLPTNGSLENILLLKAGKVDFGLYQPGTFEILKEHDPATVAEVEAAVLSPETEPQNVAFVANLYSQPAHLIVHSDSDIMSPADLEGRKVALGLKASGDYSMSLVLLDVFNLKGRIEGLNLGYSEVERQFLEGELDAALITIGSHAPVFRRLAATQTIRFITIPNGRALSQNYPFIYRYTIPSGLYSYLPSVVPQGDIETVAAGAQLLTWAGANTNLVEAVTSIVLDKNFIKQQQLEELFTGGQAFALKKPEFSLHQGAQNVYEPELRPLLNPDLVASTEGIRSFIFSAAIAVFIGFRWLRRQREHKLQQYIRSVLEIERKDMSISQTPDEGEVAILYELLKELETHRQEAFSELTAHELSEDRAANCFLLICQDLSSKINAKLARAQ